MPSVQDALRPSKFLDAPADGLFLISASPVPFQNKCSPLRAEKHPPKFPRRKGRFAMDTILNPLLPTPHADPWVFYHEGAYYYCFSEGSSVFVSRSERLSGIGRAEPVRVYTAPEGTAYSRDYWAPELHRIDGGWVIYVAADDGQNARHRMYALAGDGPQSPFRMAGKVSTPDDHWAIDGTAFSYRDKRYFVWSGWEGDVDVSQQLYIAEMADPFTLRGQRVCLSRPEYAWECVGFPTVNEGPEALIKDGALHLVYSASGSWTDDYCLGMLTLQGDDLLNPQHWSKSPQPVFSKAEAANGPGHCSFTTSPDGSEDWIVYHAIEIPGGGWDGRSVRAQKFTWEDGRPVFGSPVPLGQEQTMA